MQFGRVTPIEKIQLISLVEQLVDDSFSIRTWNFHQTGFLARHFYCQIE